MLFMMTAIAAPSYRASSTVSIIVTKVDLFVKTAAKLSHALQPATLSMGFCLHARFDTLFSTNETFSSNDYARSRNQSDHDVRRPERASNAAGRLRDVQRGSGSAE